MNGGSICFALNDPLAHRQIIDRKRPAPQARSPPKIAATEKFPRLPKDLPHGNPAHLAAVEDDRDLVVRPALATLTIRGNLGRPRGIGVDLDTAARDVHDLVNGNTVGRV